jgi:Zn-dependent membrane protease YugP
MNVINSQGHQVEGADSATKRLFNLAIFPVSAGAVGSEIAIVATKILGFTHANTAGLWTGIVCLAAALIFQVVTRKTQ